jgi:hypothetical protein
MLERANRLRGRTEFYDTLTSNCTTNLMDHANALEPGAVPYALGVLLPGYADELLLDRGLLETELSLDDARRRFPGERGGRARRRPSGFLAAYPGDGRIRGGPGLAVSGRDRPRHRGLPAGRAPGQAAPGAPAGAEQGLDAEAGGGLPRLRLGALSVQVHGRQFPDAGDYWDGNWIVVTASGSSAGSQVVVRGPILHLGEVVELREGCLSMLSERAGSAVLACTEPNLYCELVAVPRGRVRATLEITPDREGEEHVFRFEVELAEVAELARQCRALLEALPVLGEIPARMTTTDDE